MPEPSPNSIPCAEMAGLILAGGNGARLGQVRKADLVVGGRSLLDLACGNLGAQVPHITIANGGQPVAIPATNHPCAVVADPGRGPAAALLVAALDIEKRLPAAKLIVIAPCDAPFMPPDFAGRAAAHLNESTGAVIAAFGGRQFPTHAVWRISALRELHKQFAPTENPAIFALLDRVQHTVLSFDADGDANPFFNINTPADLVAANRRFADNSIRSFS